MLGKRKNTYSSGRHRILVVSVLCLFGFCLLAQVRPAKKGEQKPAKSKVYLLQFGCVEEKSVESRPGCTDSDWKRCVPSRQCIYVL